jgi:hypothetical protein
MRLIHLFAIGFSIALFSSLSVSYWAVAAETAPLPEASESNIGYPSVEAALTDLRVKPGVVVSSQNGWTVADDVGAHTIWSFPPSGHPAFPSAVKREIVQTNEGISLQMSILCQATKKACDDLVRTFQALNAQMKAAMRGAK